MSTDTYEESESLIDGVSNEQLPKGFRENLEKTKGKLTEAEQKLATLERKNAFLEAGVNPSASASAGDFFKAYDGDLSAEAVKAAALERGLIQAPAQDAATQQALQAQQKVAGLAQGAQTWGQTLSDQQQRVRQAALEADPNGTNPAARMAALAKLAQASGMPVIDP